MATVGGSRAESLPAKHESVCKIPHRRKLNRIPSASPQIKTHRPGSQGGAAGGRRTLDLKEWKGRWRQSRTKHILLEAVKTIRTEMPNINSQRLTHLYRKTGKEFSPKSLAKTVSQDSTHFWGTRLVFSQDHFYLKLIKLIFSLHLKAKICFIIQQTPNFLWTSNSCPPPTPGPLHLKLFAPKIIK